ncbi:DUF4333 domain-containing protein [Saccharomonospora glauca]|jgi:hypothetical protein|uniref:DUF4333 domain-containing protein n=1 Tax=Saccharomonospora glauca K62 TaxID=928724 RepID=I1D315_9PSEU|nr:DUF4333 domain-containing protein [Saccharomonospora glauca]EIE99339.1 hypothetical protein SacglDRAFT_02446 [Saccharomonospora glauca K62]
MSAPYGGNNPAQWGQQPPANPASGGFPQPGGYGQQPAYGQPAYGTQQPQYGQQPAPNPYEGAGTYGQQQATYPPQQQGQYGAYGQGYGQQPGGVPQGTSGGGKKLLIGLVVAVVVIAAAAVVLFWKPGLLVSKTFDEQSVEQSVQKLLVNSYGVSENSQVDCPGDQPVEKGHVYTCDVTVDGEQQTVKITVTSDEGHYTVDRPTPKG